MEIKEQIKITLSDADLRELIRESLAAKGYNVKYTRFNVESKCEGYPEVYRHVFTGVTCEVERK